MITHIFKVNVLIIQSSFVTVTLLSESELKAAILQTSRVLNLAVYSDVFTFLTYFKDERRARQCFSRSKSKPLSYSLRSVKRSLLLSTENGFIPCFIFPVALTETRGCAHSSHSSTIISNLNNILLS